MQVSRQAGADCARAPGPISGRASWRRQLLRAAAAVSGIGAAVLAWGAAPASVPSAVASGTLTPVVVESTAHGTLADLASLPRAAAQPGRPRTFPLGRPSRAQPGAPQPRLVDPAHQTARATSSMAASLTSFDGISNADQGNIGLPPDSDGAVGPNHFVQWINVALAVYSKTGTRLLGPVHGNQMWVTAGFKDPCATTNQGDPVVLYDRINARWVLSQFAFPTDVNQNPVAPFYECIAVSKTDDPTGGYNLYSFHLSDTLFEDYPKLGTWADAYYMTTNEFNSAGAGVGVGAFAFDRAAMLAGAPTARMVAFDLASLDPNLQGMLPADLEGARPAPAGSPNWVLGTDQTGTSALKLFAFHVDFTTPANSTFTSVGNLPVAPYILNTCLQPCVSQPATLQRLDAISDGRLMFRLQYRNFADHEALVATHNVDVDGSKHIGVRWYELRRSGGGAWSVFQQSTFAPDADNRWMGSAALDGSNDFAVGYSVSGTTTFPSIRYAGRLPSDPPAQLAQGEASLMSGGGSQLHASGRWGDYSALTVDPADNCTFWYTQEYYALTSSADWRTRIGSFKFPTCTGSASGGPAVITPLPQPQRLVDTRTTGGPIAAGQSRCFAVAGLAGIPANAAGVVLNVTATGYGGAGWLTLFPNGQPVPATSTLNFDPHEQAIANNAIVKLGTSGQVCVNDGQSASQVILDAAGYLPNSTGQLQLLAQPQRLIDTRVSGGPIAAGQSRCFPVAGQAGIPADAAGVVLNVTATGYPTPGWFTLFPNGQPVPATSTLNFDPTENAIANGAIARIGAAGQVCVNAGNSSAQVILDAAGYLASADGQVQLLPQPQRWVDTRSSGGPVAAGQTRCFAVASQGNVPPNANALVLNVTAVGFTGVGYLTLFPAGQPTPATSTLNFDPHESAIANGAIGGIGSGGQVCVNAGQASSDVILDIAGFTAP